MNKFQYYSSCTIAVLAMADHDLLFVFRLQVNFMASFNSSSFPDSLAIVKETSMTIGAHCRCRPHLCGRMPNRVHDSSSAQSLTRGNVAAMWPALPTT